MNQIAILSGKGGTGKTVITAALSAIVDNKVMADCDVDAADLHLLLTPNIIERHQFKSGKKARLDARACVRCGRCFEVCRFEAITKNLLIDTGSCEGCGLCARVCPVSAITMKENMCGEWFVSQTRFGMMVHARLGIGEENSGKLVAQIRQKTKQIAQEFHRDWVIIDGPPGIGCPVMASLSGVNAVLLVTEPTCSGLHDVGRLIDLCHHFKIPTGLVVNKWDLNEQITKDIESFCQERKIHLLGRVSFHRDVVDVVVLGETIMETGNEDLKKQIEKIWINLKMLMI